MIQEEEIDMSKATRQPSNLSPHHTPQYLVATDRH
jgi:hypothetical protein